MLFSAVNSSCFIDVDSGVTGMIWGLCYSVLSTEVVVSVLLTMVILHCVVVSVLLIGGDPGHMLFLCCWYPGHVGSFLSAVVFLSGLSSSDLVLIFVVSVLMTVMTLALFGALYSLQLSKNFMMFDDYKIGWRSEGHTNLDFSYFLIIGAAVAFVINFGLLCLSGQSLNCSYAGSGEKEVDNGMILY